MSSLWQQLHALRTPPDLKASLNEDLNHHITHTVLPFLAKIPTKAIIISEDNTSPDLLEILHPTFDTLPYLHVLITRINTVLDTSKNQVLPDTLARGSLRQSLRLFIDNFDQIEIRYAGAGFRWHHLMNCFDRITRFENVPPVLEDMAKAMLRLDPSLSTFTSAHLLFVRLCLQTNYLHEAPLIITRDCHNLPNQDCPNGTLPCTLHETSNDYITFRSELTNPIDLNDTLEYHLLAANIFIALHDWSQAIYQLEHVLLAPSNNVVHVFMLEAYRKWLLLGLIMDGTMRSLPKSVNSTALKTMKSASKHYESVVKAFKHDDSRRLCAEVSEGQTLWAEDGNAGLIRHVVNRHQELSVIRMGEVYAAVSLSMLIVRLNLPAAGAEAYLASLIDRGLLNAIIEPNRMTGQGYVIRFLGGDSNDSIAPSEDQLRIRLARQSNRLRELSQNVDEADRRLSLSREYLDHVRRLRKAFEHEQSSPEPEGLNVPFVTGTVSDEDENVMEDVG